MIKVIDPKIGETIYDGACGSAGFLCESWEYMRRDDLSSAEWNRLPFGGGERIEAIIEIAPHGQAEELVKHSAIEALDEAVGAGGNSGATMLDAVEAEIELVGVRLGAAEPAATVSEHSA